MLVSLIAYLGVLTLKMFQLNAYVRMRPLHTLIVCDSLVFRLVRACGSLISVTACQYKSDLIRPKMKTIS